MICVRCKLLYYKMHIDFLTYFHVAFPKTYLREAQRQVLVAYIATPF